MKQQGFIEQDFYLSQTNEHKTRLDQIKKEKALLMDTSLDVTISKSKRLIKTLESMPDHIDISEKEILLALVHRIIVKSEIEVGFILTNGMVLTECLRRVVR